MVTGRVSGKASGVLEKIAFSLERQGLSVEVCDFISGEPTCADVDRIREVVRKSAAYFVVGAGGGSAMDAAKAAAGLAAQSDRTAVFLHEERASTGALPFLAVPTTSGSGAEVTANAVITDPDARVKKSIRGEAFLAAAVLVDPELTASCPPHTTAHSGCDALVQAVEAFVSRNATPLTDALASEAFRLLWCNLHRAYSHGSDIKARSACAWGSLLAGIALANARLGAVHGMAHSLGVRLGAPHGLICAVLMSEVVRKNMAVASRKYTRLEAIAGASLPEGLEALNRKLDIYRDFAQYTLPRHDFAAIAEESLSSSSLKANPEKFEKEDVIAVLDRLADRSESLEHH